MRIRVHAHGGVDVRLLLGDLQHAGEVFQRDGDAQRMRDAVLAHAGQQFRQARAQVGEIDVAV
jgi:hypothetical protein